MTSQHKLGRVANDCLHAQDRSSHCRMKAVVCGLILTRTENGNGRAEIRKWSSILVALMASFAHALSVWGYISS